MPIVKKDNNISNNFGFYKDKELILEEPDIKEDNIDLQSKSLDIRSCARNICQDLFLRLGYLKLSCHNL